MLSSFAFAGVISDVESVMIHTAIIFILLFI